MSKPERPETDRQWLRVGLSWKTAAMCRLVLLNKEAE